MSILGVSLYVVGLILYQIIIVLLCGFAFQIWFWVLQGIIFSKSLLRIVRWLLALFCWSLFWIFSFSLRAGTMSTLQCAFLSLSGPVPVKYSMRETISVSKLFLSCDLSASFSLLPRPSAHDGVWDRLCLFSAEVQCWPPKNYVGNWAAFEWTHWFLEKGIFLEL